MNDRDVKNRKIGPERIKKILEQNGPEISQNQAIQITDFVYTIAETLIGRGFMDHQSKRKKSINKKRL